MLIYSSIMGGKVSWGFVTLFSICSLAYVDCQWRWSCNNWIWILHRFTYRVTVEVKVGSKINVVECLGGPKPRKKAAAEHAAEGALWYLRGLGHKIWRISNCPINKDTQFVYHHWWISMWIHWVTQNKYVFQFQSLCLIFMTKKNSLWSEHNNSWLWTQGVWSLNGTMLQIVFEQQKHLYTQSDLVICGNLGILPDVIAY